MPRPPSPRQHPSAHAVSEDRHADIVQQVADAVDTVDVVVVGMGWNPHVKRAKAALDEAGHSYTYLEFGNYTSKWQERLAVKMWSGWPSFPQVFVKGGLLGGADETSKAIGDGTLTSLLASDRPS